MYSQYEEETYILTALEGRTGRYLDIGAYNAKVFSNTRALYELGWYGVLVEPNPLLFYNLLRTCSGCGELIDFDKEIKCPQCQSDTSYANDSRIVLINAAVGRETCMLRMFATNDATSTADKSTHEKWRNVVRYYGEFYTGQITLEQLSNQFGGFDFVNIDAEGMSTDLFFRMLDLEWSPRCVCLEHDGRLIELAGRYQNRYRQTYLNGTNIVLEKI